MWRLVAMPETIRNNGHEEVYDEVMKSSNDDSHDPEKYPESNDSRSIHDIKLDADGLPLVPQPSRFKDDPLVRPFCNANSCLVPPPRSIAIE